MATHLFGQEIFLGDSIYNLVITRQHSLSAVPFNYKCLNLIKPKIARREKGDNPINIKFENTVFFAFYNYFN